MRHEDAPRPAAKESQPVCRERPCCLNCPYPAHGFICWGGDENCMKMDLHQIYGKEAMKSEKT